MQEGKERQGMRGWLRVVLFASLAMNLLIVGLVAGAAFRGGPFRDGGPGGREPVTPYTRAFEEDQRKDLRRALARAFVGARDGTRSEITLAYREALGLLRADPYDADAMRAVLRKQAELSDTRRRKGEDVLGSYLAGMTVEERRAYADRLEAEIVRFGRKRGDHDGKRE